MRTGFMCARLANAHPPTMVFQVIVSAAVMLPVEVAEPAYMTRCEVGADTAAAKASCGSCEPAERKLPSSRLV